MSSDNFPNMPSESALPEIGLYDPNNTAQEARHVDGESPMVGPGGKTKISSTDMGGPSSQGQSGYGFMTNDASMKSGGVVTGTTLPVAQPITPMTSGDPNNTAVDMDEAESKG